MRRLRCKQQLAHPRCRPLEPAGGAAATVVAHLPPRRLSKLSPAHCRLTPQDTPVAVRMGALALSLVMGASALPAPLVLPAAAEDAPKFELPTVELPKVDFKVR